ncbi:hypothetical protein HPB48_010060 [Haemaphysalis longicornis]|uniref:Uncharacterized protein n=1 Tax=Haemaphysalis longicornis TaxID=44386 RepID=A0A9J6FDA4_HAELO|nr:hypothetical protein HPB48_010060 [Haemaphysalis longicornis]
MKDIQNTVMYWQERKREVFAMIGTVGNLNAFLTMSGSEVHTYKLIAMLHRLQARNGCEIAPVKNLRNMDRVQFCNDIPFAVAMYCHRMFSVLLNIFVRQEALADPSIPSAKLVPYLVLNSSFAVPSILSAIPSAKSVVHM